MYSANSYRNTCLAACICLATTVLSAQERTPDRQLLDPELKSMYQGAGINPFDAVAANNLAVKLVQQGSYEKALKLLVRAQRLDPNRTDISANVQRVEQLLAQYAQLPNEVALDYKQTFDDAEVPFVSEPWESVEGPAEPGPVQSLASDQQPVDSSNPFDAGSLMRVARVRENRGDYRGALDSLRRAEELSPYQSGVRAEIERLTRLIPDIEAIDVRQFVSEATESNNNPQTNVPDDPLPWISTTSNPETVDTTYE